MPSTKTTTKKMARKAGSRKPRAAVKKRAVTKKTSRRVKKAETAPEEQPSVMNMTQIPVPPAPEPIQEEPQAMEVEAEQVPPAPQPEPVEKADEVQPVISEGMFSVFRTRTSFYAGVLTGAALVHVLLFAIVAIITS